MFDITTAPDQVLIDFAKVVVKDLDAPKYSDEQHGDQQKFLDELVAELSKRGFKISIEPVTVTYHEFKWQKE